MPRKQRPKAKPLVNNGQRTLLKSELRAVRLFGGDLQDAREEMFVRMVADGLSMGVSYVRAGFVARTANAATDLFRQPHIQRRIEAVLEARRTQGVVTLPEVTDMLKRVFAGANSEGEYSAAHNAAFSLARLYGHVTDKATLEVLRKPSREPDAPSEQVLGDWVSSLPGQTIDATPIGLSEPSGGPPRGVPAPLLGPGTMLSADNIAGPEPSGPEPSGRGAAGATRRDGTENGAPVGPVTGTPDRGGRSAPLVPLAHDVVSRETNRSTTRIKQKRVPSGTKRVPVKKRGRPRTKFPKAEELF
jgi:hypothetical protein